MAAAWTPAEGLTVTDVWVEDNLIVVHTTGSHASSCHANNWVVKSTTSETRQQAFSLLVTALSTGQKVRFYFQDTCANWGYGNIASTRLLKAN